LKVKIEILAFLTTQAAAHGILHRKFESLPPEFKKIVVPYNLTFIKALKIGNTRFCSRLLDKESTKQEPPAFY